MRIPQPISAVLTLVVLLGLATAGCTAAPYPMPATAIPSLPAPGEVAPQLAAAYLRAEVGGTVDGPDGVTLRIPPNVLLEDGEARVHATSANEYDIHIDPAWRGSVQVVFPLTEGLPIIAHQRDSEWVLEDARVEDGRAVADIDSLSTFSTLKECFGHLKKPGAGTALSIVKCLAKLGIKKLPEVIGKKIVGVFNEYDACKPISVTNWTIDALEILFGSCKLSDPRPPDAPTTVRPTSAPAPTSPPPRATSAPVPTSVPPRTTSAPVPTSVPPRTTSAPAPAPSISLSMGGQATKGYWYSVVLSGFTPGSQVSVRCHDSVDPGGFYTQTMTINSDGRAIDTTLCYSADGPDHWVTAGSTTSNHVTWTTQGPAPTPVPSISLSMGGQATKGYWYSVVLSGFTPGSQVSVRCHDSVDPGGFYTQAMTINSDGRAADTTLCYSADGPDHWVTAGSTTSNHASW